MEFITYNFLENKWSNIIFWFSFFLYFLNFFQVIIKFRQQLFDY